MMTDKDTGLTQQEVIRRKKAGLANEAVKNQSKTIGQIIAGNVFTYFNLIFAVFAGMLILVHSYINMTFLPIIVCNTMIGIIQEIRSKRVLDKLTLLNAPHTETIRDGIRVSVCSEELVQGDVCIFEGGNQICADALILEGQVRVNEALVTGEADEIVRGEGDALLSGSFVVSGSCKAVLEHVGLSSYASKLAMEAKASRKKQQTEMMRSLDSLVKLIGVLIIPIGILMFIQSYFRLGHTVQQSVVSMIAALVGMIPEGLYLLASVALVVSVMRLGRKNVLVHEMACVETLARVNVLCVDKTGTITENKMSVQKVIDICPSEESARTASGRLIGRLARCMEADNATMQAIKEYFQESAAGTALQVFPFSSETKYSGAIFEDGAYILGAPERVLLSSYEDFREQVEEIAGTGSRVLVFGSYPENPGGKPLKMPVTPLALVVLSNPVRREARDTFAYFARQGVEIKVISGDNPATASYVAQQAGIEGACNYLDASSLQTDAQIQEAVCSHTVFGRVQPQQKKKIIQALQKEGKVVAMTGDGVNDVLALKCADCSVAMASGSDAAENAAQIVLLDSDFSCMPSVVLEGRRVVNNIQRSASLFLVKTIFSMLTTFFALIAAARYPIYPTQLSLLGAFTIGAPAFFLALQPNRDMIRGHFLTNVILRALPPALTDFIVMAAFSILGRFLGIPHEQLSTIITYIMLAVGLMALFRVCMPFNYMRAAVCISMMCGIVFSILVLGRLFALYPLAAGQMMLAAAGIAAAVPVFLILCVAVNKWIAWYAAHNRNFHNRINMSLFKGGH